MGSAVSVGRSRKYEMEVEHAWVEAKKSCQNPDSVQNNKTVVIRRSGWKTIRIFVSSTFKDFHQEREVLVKEVFPDLREWCEKRRLHLIDCDLRWGVPQEAREEVLQYCLKEIDRCFQDNVFPFFVNMTSERIGWIPSSEEVARALPDDPYNWIHGLSITEMEILHAAYRKDNPNALFLLRDANFINHVPPDYRSYFIDGSPIAPIKLRKLKEAIANRFPKGQVFKYDCEFAGLDRKTNTVKMKKLEKFKETVFSFFKNRVEAQYPMEAAVNDPYITAQEQHEAFMKNKARNVLGRGDLLKQAVDFTQNGSDEGVPLILLGEAGIGKTSIVAKLADEIQQEQSPGTNDTGWTVFVHFIGSCPGSTDYTFFLKRLLKHLDPKESENRDEETLTHLLRGILCSPTVRPTVIIVDAANQFDEREGQSIWAWLPVRTAPQIRCICSMIADTTSHNSLKTRTPKPSFLSVTPLDKASRKDIVQQLLMEFHKQLNDDQMNMLLAKKSSENPLWLSLACEELRLFGVYRQLTQKIQSLADGLLELEVQLLERFEQENGGELVIATLCLLECASTGLLETELKDILGNREKLMPTSFRIEPKDNTRPKTMTRKNVGEPLSAIEWAMVFRALKPFLRPFGSSGEGRLDFYHRSFSKAVRMRYFNEERRPKGATDDGAKIYAWWHKKLADYFRTYSNIERKAEEYPYQLEKAGLKNELADCLCDWEIFEHLYSDEHNVKLLRYWRQIPGGLETMETRYSDAIDRLKKDTSCSVIEYSERFYKVILVLVQGARYNTATEYLKQLKTLEEEKLGSRKEKLAQILWLAGHIIDETFAQENYMNRGQLTRIKVIIDNFERSLSLYRQLSGNANRKKVAKILSRLAFWYGGWHLRGGNEELSASEANIRAIRYADEAIETYRDLDDDAGVADALISRGVVIGKSVPEVLEFYMDAEEILLRTKGELFFNLSRLYLNKAIYFEETGDYYKAYDQFLKWHHLNKELHGPDHPYTKRTVETLNEPMYRRIASEKDLPIPNKTDGNPQETVPEKEISELTLHGEGRRTSITFPTL